MEVSEEVRLKLGDYAYTRSTEAVWRMKYIEFMSRARIAVEYCMGVKPGENVLIVTDTRISEYMGADALNQAIMAASQAAGAEAHMIIYTPREHPSDELPRVAAAAMKSADAIFTNPTRSLTHTFAMRHARDAGARVIMLGAGDYITQDTLYRLFPTSVKEIDDMALLTKKLGDTHKGKVKITSSEGTNLTLEVGKLRVHINTGIAHESGCCEVLPPGETSAGVTEGSAEGKIVFDGSIIPIYHPLTEPIVCTVKDNFITNIEGGKDAQEYRKYLQNLDDPMVYNIAEFGIGTNPKCKLSGTPLEDERIFGAVHIGIGTNINFGGKIKSKTHTDGMILHPTVRINDILIVENGEFKF